MALKTAHKIVPEVYPTYLNFYEPSSRAFHFKGEISIDNGVIQGCGLATGFYDVSIHPLVNEMKDANVNQHWVADELVASGNPSDLANWYCKLLERRPKYGYHIKPPKSCILAHDNKQVEEFQMWERSKQIKHSIEGQKYLGGSIGKETFKTEFYKNKVAS